MSLFKRGLYLALDDKRPIKNNTIGAPLKTHILKTRETRSKTVSLNDKNVKITAVSLKNFT